MGPTAAELSIKHIGIMLCAYAFFLSCVQETYPRRQKYIGCAAAVLIGTVGGAVYNILPFVWVLIMMALYYWMVGAVFGFHSDRKITLIIYSLFLSYILYYFAIGVTALLLWLNKTAVAYRFDRSVDAWIYVLHYVTIYKKSAYFARCFVLALHCLLLTALLKQRRVKRELIGFMNIGKSEVWVFLWAVVFSVKALSDMSVLSRNDPMAVMITCVFLIVLLFFICYFWIKKELNALYKIKLQENELDILENSLADKDELLRILLADNERISEMIHKDNKLIPSIVMSVSKAAEPGEKGDESGSLFNALDELYASRRNAVREYENHSQKLIRTGVTAVDAAMLFLQGRADTAGISLTASIPADLPDMLTDDLRRSEFIAILADLCEYALLSAKRCGGKVALHIGHDGDNLFIEASDNGGAFDIGTLNRIGKNADNVSKVGLIPLFWILRHNGARFTLNEFADNAEFTQSLRVTFVQQ